MSGYGMEVGARAKDAAGRRRSLALLAGGIVAAALVIVWAWRERPLPEPTPPIEARLELAVGDVRVEGPGGERTASSGSPLRAGARLRTGEGGRAFVRLPDGSAVLLRGGSAVVLAANGTTLEAGGYWLEAPADERAHLVHRVASVEVTAADAGVDLRREGERVSVYVARGRATVSSAGGRAELSAGEQATTNGAGSPEVAPLPYWEDWTGGLADTVADLEVIGEGSGAVFAVDDGQAGAAQRLQIKSQSVRATLQDGLSETEVDQTFFNPSPRVVEGWYWFTVPERAIVTGFAVEFDGKLVEGELIERREAAAKYGAAKEAGHAPALLEWVDARTYRARLFPIAASATRRVVLRYLEHEPVVDDKLEYVYPMGHGTPVRIGELAITVELGSAGERMKLATLADARVEDGGQRVTMRRSGFTPRADFQLEAKLAAAPPVLRVARRQGASGTADYVLARYRPEVDWGTIATPPADVVVVVDTSAGADEALRPLRVAVAEAILRALGPGDRFALLSVDARAVRLFPATAGLATAGDGEVTKALEALAGHADGGASDLEAMFPAALPLVHSSEQPALVYVGDGIATIGALRGEQLVERLRRSLATSRARLFTVAVGANADHALLGELARAGGGEGLRIDRASELSEAAIALAAKLKEPTITDLGVDLGAGLDEPFVSSAGKVARGDEVLVLARTHHDLPKTARIHGRLGGQPFERVVKIEREDGALGEAVPRLWAAEYVRRLLGAAGSADDERGRIVGLGLDYGLMTPYTSFLALESEWAYRDMGVERRTRSRAGLATAKDRAKNDDAEDEKSAEEVPSQHAWGNDRVDDKRDEGGSGRRVGGGAIADSTEFGMIGLLNSGAGSGGLQGWTDTPAADTIPRLARQVVLRCSDLARLPLSQRLPVWRKRLRTAQSPPELVQRFIAAQAACEVGDWQAERAFWRLLVVHVDSEAAATVVLGSLAGRADVQRFVAGLMLRRAVDPAVVNAVERSVFGVAVDWNKIDLKLSEIEQLDARIAELRKSIARAPEDPQGDVRLVELLARAGKSEEALAAGRRLRERGLLTVAMARRLGDALARAGLEEDATRAYSEIVEFDPASLAARRELGDALLGRGWYEPAYRQYATALELSASDPLSSLRLAAAAAGAGRIDEALRLERGVASAEGQPGPSDPRRWARLWSAARLARLIAVPPPDARTQAGAIERRLKELGLFSGPATLVLLTWEQLDADVVLVTEEGEREIEPTERVEAAASGLTAVTLSADERAKLRLVARLRSAPDDEAIPLVAHTIAWDGAKFTVDVKRHELPPSTTRLEL